MHLRAANMLMSSKTMRDDLLAELTKCSSMLVIDAPSIGPRLVSGLRLWTLFLDNIFPPFARCHIRVYPIDITGVVVLFKD